jgi:hypothetical protein
MHDILKRRWPMSLQHGDSREQFFCLIAGLQCLGVAELLLSQCELPGGNGILSRTKVGSVGLGDGLHQR